mmetsp:Transcript_2987/g.5057  ORF Transcript_2987/g.5057 Transcript_2987/m.5057 type:complete len:105 (+) Transcript_2987:199-513(+)
MLRIHQNCGHMPSSLMQANVGSLNKRTVDHKTIQGPHNHKRLQKPEQARLGTGASNQQSKLTSSSVLGTSVQGTLASHRRSKTGGMISQQAKAGNRFANNYLNR